MKEYSQPAVCRSARNTGTTVDCEGDQRRLCKKHAAQMEGVEVGQMRDQGPTDLFASLTEAGPNGGGCRLAGMGSSGRGSRGSRPVWSERGGKEHCFCCRGCHAALRLSLSCNTGAHRSACMHTVPSPSVLARPAGRHSFADFKCAMERPFGEGGVEMVFHVEPSERMYPSIMGGRALSKRV